MLSNPKHKRTRLGLNNTHYYFISCIATHENDHATFNSFISGPLLNVDNFVSMKEKHNPNLTDIVITNYKKINKHEFLKLTQ